MDGLYLIIVLSASMVRTLVKFEWKNCMRKTTIAASKKRDSNRTVQIDEAVYCIQYTSSQKFHMRCMRTTEKKTHTEKMN